MFNDRGVVKKNNGTAISDYNDSIDVHINWKMFITYYF